MGVLSRWRRRRSPRRAISEEEQIARYVYLLGSLPSSVIEKAHADAFRDLPPETRREMFDRLRPFMADGERADPESGDLLAVLVRRAEERRARRAGAAEVAAGGAVASTTALAATGTPADPRDDIDPRALLGSVGVMSVVAHHFLLSSALTTYFTVGAGAMLGGQPAWIGDVTGVETVAVGGMDGAGFDAGAGGFDVAGFGGFDAGGGLG
ncbi:hypothetical protein [Microbacterium xanthum]|uniref:hypothetical protein n=1 Tax=Microbacterium xanthum TaxID=3079794 RepID=UPI002AD2D7CF|nr:hypothetical protein [Microbacterium sp. KSW-48]MDZ8172605.1 hypothetical protein [Microbacterium sp. KSW-48]